MSHSYLSTMSVTSFKQLLDTAPRTMCTTHKTQTGFFSLAAAGNGDAIDMSRELAGVSEA